MTKSRWAWHRNIGWGGNVGMLFRPKLLHNEQGMEPCVVLLQALASGGQFEIHTETACPDCFRTPRLNYLVTVWPTGTYLKWMMPRRLKKNNQSRLGFPSFRWTLPTLIHPLLTLFTGIGVILKYSGFITSEYPTNPISFFALNTGQQMCFSVHG